MLIYQKSCLLKIIFLVVCCVFFYSSNGVVIESVEYDSFFLMGIGVLSIDVKCYLQGNLMFSGVYNVCVFIN